MEAQATRLRIVSENIANSRTTGDGPGADPYRRKTITFANELDRATGTNLVEVKNAWLRPLQLHRGIRPGQPGGRVKKAW